MASQNKEVEDVDEDDELKRMMNNESSNQMQQLNDEQDEHEESNEEKLQKVPILDDFPSHSMLSSPLFIKEFALTLIRNSEDVCAYHSEDNELQRNNYANQSMTNLLALILRLYVNLQKEKQVKKKKIECNKATKDSLKASLFSLLAIKLNSFSYEKNLFLTLDKRATANAKDNLITVLAKLDKRISEDLGESIKEQLKLFDNRKAKIAKFLKDEIGDLQQEAQDKFEDFQQQDGAENTVEFECLKKLPQLLQSSECLVRIIKEITKKVPFKVLDGNAGELLVHRLFTVCVMSQLDYFTGLATGVFVPSNQNDIDEDDDDDDDDDED